MRYRAHPFAVKTSPSKYVVTCVVVALAIVAALAMYSRYVNRPWTRDAQVRANVIGIAPRVEGPIIQIPIKDNEPVKKVTCFLRSTPRRSRLRSTTPPPNSSRPRPRRFNPSRNSSVRPSSTKPR